MTKEDIAKAKTESIKLNAQAKIDSLNSQQIKNSVDDIWVLIIDGFFLSDIENLEQIKLNSGKAYGLAAVAQLLSITSMLELLGKTLYDGDELLYFKKHDKAWDYYFSHYIPDEYKVLNQPIQNLLRHGAAHLFLPREVGLSKRPHEKLFFEEDGTIIFNVATFTKLFKDSLMLVKKDLDENQEVAKRFLIRYERIRLTNQQVDADHNFSTVIRNYINSLMPRLPSPGPVNYFPPTTIPIGISVPPKPSTSGADNNIHAASSDE